jgi:hypothetical protein
MRNPLPIKIDQHMGVLSVQFICNGVFRTIRRTKPEAINSRRYCYSKLGVTRLAKPMVSMVWRTADTARDVWGPQT